VIAGALRLVGLAACAAVIATSPAGAQGKGPFGGFKHDSKAPIEITANTLEVRQAEKLAVFSGEVVAGQGTLRLTADRVEVNYTAEKSDNDTGAIQKMRAEGNVFLSNDSETAQGEWAEYDVAGGIVRMGGNVVLTQGGNAISGQSLVIDLNAGTGRVEGGTGRVTSTFKPSGKPSTGN